MRILIGMLIVGVLAGGYDAARAAQNQAEENSCKTCHFTEQAEQATHLINRLDDCGSCHSVSDPLGSHEVQTTREAYTCQTCHHDQDQATEQASGHTALLCVDCHQPHRAIGSDPLLAKPVMDLCAESCHTSGELGISHPAGPGIEDQTTGEELTCVSTCHSMHRPLEDKLLQLASDDLCQQCHAEKY